ncbi:MAG: endo-alpha-N-acetylgalactosaminidase family protein [Anaerorhabdus sp.]
MINNEISGEFYDWKKTLKPERAYLHKYHETLVLKMLLSLPDNKGGSIVYCNFEEALKRIIKLNQITLNVPKIIYLVGWQFNGHDDSYPSWEIVNDNLKRREDSCADDSLRWLIKEAKKHHTTVSLHINMTDAYKCSPLWNEYLENNLISKNIFNKPKKIGKWNGRVAYQINYKNEYLSGYAQKRIDSLIERFNLDDVKTIHIDAFFCRSSIRSKVTIEDEMIFRRKIIRYWRNKGVDVTSEFLYCENGVTDLIGLVPLVWWINQSENEYLNRPASLICGGKPNRKYKKYKKYLDRMFGKSIHGEDAWVKQGTSETNLNWEEEIIEKFCLDTLPFFFLNSLDRIAIIGKGKEKRVQYSNNFISYKNKHFISDGKFILKDGKNVVVPNIFDQCNSLILYSIEGYSDRTINLPKEWHQFSEVVFLIDDLKQEITVKDGQIELSLLPKKMTKLVTKKSVYYD